MSIVELLTLFTDTLFPPREEEHIVRALTLSMVEEMYQTYNVNDWTALSSYKDARVRALIHEAKYEGNVNAQKLLAEFIHLHAKNLLLPDDVVWIPMPLHPARLRARGYNQVTRILHEAHGTYQDTVLVRVRNTKSQTELSRTERLINMNNAFTCISPEIVCGKSVIIVDDVVTTGATLQAAKKAIMEHGPKSVILLALAH